MGCIKNKYVVRLVLYIGDYQKQVTNLVQAADEEAAKLQALEDESHNDSAGYGVGFCADWEDGDMVYIIDSVEQVTDAEYAVLNTYL